MTILAVARDARGGVAFGTDSGVFRGSLVSRAGEKSITLGAWIMLTTGTLRVRSYLRDLWDEHDGSSDTARHGLFTDPIDPERSAQRIAAALWSLHKRDGLAEQRGPDLSTDYGVVAVHRPTGRFWYLDGLGAACEHDPYLCVGAGEDMASAAVDVLLRHGPFMRAETLVSRALETACALHTHCAAPVHVHTLKEPER